MTTALVNTQRQSLAELQSPVLVCPSRPTTRRSQQGAGTNKEMSETNKQHTIARPRVPRAEAEIDEPIVGDASGAFAAFAVRPRRSSRAQIAPLDAQHSSHRSSQPDLSESQALFRVRCPYRAELIRLLTESALGSALVFNFESV